jgi:ribosomal protein L15
LISKNDKLKIIGNDLLSQSLKVVAHKYTKNAKISIEQSGGSAESV